MTPTHVSPRSARAFTLVELMVSIALLSVLLLMLSSMTETTSRAWGQGQSRTDAYQSARSALEILSRELSPAVVDTRMQFVVAPPAVLTKAGAKNVAPESPVLLWMAPLGDDGKLRCVGYYLFRDTTRNLYRLKRIFIAPAESGKESPYFPRMVNLANPRDVTLRTSPIDAAWFTRKWDQTAFNEEDPKNEEAVVSSAADGVIALWAQCVDVLGRPIPVLSKAAYHPKSTLFYNSAAYFQVATTVPFEDGKSFSYLAETPQSMKANRVPAAVDLTVVTLDPAVLVPGTITVPEQLNVFTKAGTLDVETSLQQFHEKLQQNRIYTARTFTTRVKLTNGS